jgi:hypothetical protein
LRLNKVLFYQAIEQMAAALGTFWGGPLKPRSIMGMDGSWTQRQAMRFWVSLSDAHSRKVIGIQLIEK